MARLNPSPSAEVDALADDLAPAHDEYVLVTCHGLGVFDCGEDVAHEPGVEFEAHLSRWPGGDLVDELGLHLAPVLLGTGTRWLPTPAGASSCHVTSDRPAQLSHITYDVR